MLTSIRCADGLHGLHPLQDQEEVKLHNAWQLAPPLDARLCMTPVTERRPYLYTNYTVCLPCLDDGVDRVHSPGIWLLVCMPL